jgi:CheY-like chemotaxis protein
MASRAIAELKPGEHLPEIIFVTAIQEHAVRAFEVHAVDYLLKPVSFERFREAVRLARARLEARAAEGALRRTAATDRQPARRRQPGSRLAYEREFWVRTRDGIVRVPAETIDAITAEGDYVLLHAGDKSHLLKDTISSLAHAARSGDAPARAPLDDRQPQAGHGLHRRGPKGMSLTLGSGRSTRSGRITSKPCSRSSTRAAGAEPRRRQGLGAAACP